MTSLFKNISESTIFGFSPDFYAAVQDAQRRGVKSLGSLRYTEKEALAMPAALAMGALEGFYIPASPDGSWDPRTTALKHFGSVSAYVIAKAGNSHSINMLQLIASLPNLCIHDDGSDKSRRRLGLAAISERVGLAALRYAAFPDRGKLLMAGLHHSYADLLGINSDGIPDFNLCNNKSDIAISSLVHADIAPRVYRETEKRKAINAQDILAYAEPLLTALTITQPQIWIEQGVDPSLVKDLIHRRVHGFWSMMRMKYPQKDELAEVAIQAAFSAFPSLKAGKSHHFWGASLETCRLIGEGKNLNVLKYGPIALGGVMSAFRPVKSTSMPGGLDVFAAVSNREWASFYLQEPWQNRLTSDLANRGAIWSLGRHMHAWPLASETVVKSSLFDWHISSSSKSPKHPLVPSYIHWHEFLNPGQWVQMYEEKILRNPGSEHAEVFLREFSIAEPEAYDSIALKALSDRRMVRLHRALMPHITSNMKSMRLLNSCHLDRVFTTDLGL